MPLARARGLVCVVTDRRRLYAEGTLEAQLAAVVAQAVAAAGADADLFQIRERDLADLRLHALVRDVLAATRGSQMRIIVNDRIDVALAAGAHGVQLPSAGLGVKDARTLAPAGWLVGRSIHGSDVADAPLDWVIFGTVFPSQSKGGDRACAGLDALANACRRSPVPVLAIGGVTAGTVTQVAAASSGIAAIGWFATTDARRLAEAVQTARRAFDTITPVI